MRLKAIRQRVCFSIISLTKWFKLEKEFLTAFDTTVDEFNDSNLDYDDFGGEDSMITKLLSLTDRKFVVEYDERTMDITVIEVE